MDNLMKHLKEAWALFESDSITNKVSLIPDLYEDEEEVFDTSEIRSEFIDESDLEKEFTIKVMEPQVAKTIESSISNSTVWEVYNASSSNEQKKLVQYKVKNWDDDRIVLLMGKTLLDGNHHLIAGILSNNKIKYIDLSEG